MALVSLAPQQQPSATVPPSSPISKPGGRPARRTSLWGRFVLRLTPAEAEAYDLYLHSIELYHLARQVSFSSRDGEDAAWLLRKSLYQLLLAALLLDGINPASFAECQERIADSPELAKLYGEALPDAAFLDDATASFALVRDEAGEYRERYLAIVRRMPALQRRMRAHLAARAKRAGRNLAQRQWAGVAALAAFVVAAFLGFYGSCRRDDGAPAAAVPAEDPIAAADPKKCFKAIYFNGVDLTKVAHKRHECFIDFDWGEAPVAGVQGIGADSFSVRWEGWLRAPATDLYHFKLSSDDGSRLFLNGQLIIDNWGEHVLMALESEPVSLTEGVDYPIRVEYFEAQGVASVRLEWRRTSRDMEVLPGTKVWRSSTGADLVLPVESDEVQRDPTKCFTARYFNGTELKDEVAVRRDCRIDFDWGLDAVPGIRSSLIDGFSVRWEGLLAAPADDEYTFFVGSDDGARLYLRDELIVDEWNEHAYDEVTTRPVKLRKDQKVPIRFDFFERDGMAAARLMWSSNRMSKRPVAGRYVTATGAGPSR